MPTPRSAVAAESSAADHRSCRVCSDEWPDQTSPPVPDSLSAQTAAAAGSMSFRSHFACAVAR